MASTRAIAAAELEAAESERTKLIACVVNAAAPFEAAKLTSTALTVASEPTFGLDADLATCVRREADGTFELAAALVASVRLVSNVTFGEVADSVTSCDLIACRVATFAEAAARTSPVRLTTSATFGEAATLVADDCLIAAVAWGLAADLVSLACLKIAATLGKVPVSVLINALTAWRLARFGEATASAFWPCLTPTATFGDTAARVTLGDLTT